MNHFDNISDHLGVLRSRGDGLVGTIDLVIDRVGIPIPNVLAIEITK